MFFRKLIILIASACTGIIIILCFAVRFLCYNEENIRLLINDYIYSRYDDVSAENLIDRYNNNRVFYSNNFLNKDSWFVNTSQLQESLMYFQTNEFSSSVISVSIKRIDKKTYITHVVVQYVNARHDMDNVVNYTFQFILAKTGWKSYLFDEISVLSNDIIYLSEAEFYVVNGVAVPVSEIEVIE